MVIIFTLLMNLVAWSASLDDWTLKTEKNGIAVYTRKPDGERIKELKIITKIKCPINELMYALEDIESHIRWVFKCSESTIVERDDPSNFYYYVKSDFPFPAKDRDLVIHYRRTQDPKSYVIYTESSSANDLVPVKKPAIRITEFQSSYTITPSSDGWNRIEYVLKADPAGALPAWIINLGISKGPVKTMQALFDLIDLGVYKGKKVEGLLDPANP